MAKLSKELAWNLSRVAPADYDWQELRDWCDSATAGDMDCWQLDRLTDWVSALVTGRDHG